MKSELKADFSDNKRGRGRQLDSSDDPVGNRIIHALAGRQRKWLADASGLSQSTISDCIKSGISKTEPAIAIANALGCSVDWLLTGGAQLRSAAVASVENSDWIDVPEHDLREMDDAQRGPVVSVTPFRRDWLNRTLGYSTGLWIARLPSDLPRFSLAEGDPVFLLDVPKGEEIDGAVYIVRVWGHLTVARLDSMLSASMSSIDSNLADRRIGFRDLGTEDGKAVLVARVLGAPLRKL